MKNIPLDHNYIQNEIFVCVRTVYIFFGTYYEVGDKKKRVE